MKEKAPMIKIPKEEKGFTLLEAMVAISLLTFGLLGVASMQAAAIKGNAFAGGITEATTLAGDRMEYLMTQNYDDPSDNTELLDDVDGDGTSGLEDATSATADHSRTYDNENGMRYNLYWNTARDAPDTDTTTIKVIVTWEDRGVQRQVSIQGIVARIG